MEHNKLAPGLSGGQEANTGGGGGGPNPGSAWCGSPELGGLALDRPCMDRRETIVTGILI